MADRRQPCAARRTVTAPESHAFDVDGIRLVVHDWGGAGAPVLLAHPTGFHGRIWAPVAERLVGAGRHVYSFDFRGHGDSDAPPLDEENYSWHGFADDALAVDPSPRARRRRRPPRRAATRRAARRCCSAKPARTGTYPRIWAYEPIMFPSETPLPPHAGVRMADVGAPAPQRVAVDRGRVRRVRVEAAAQRDDRRSRCTRTSTTGCATAATACSSSSAGPRSRRRSTRWARTTARSASCPDVASPVRVVCGEASTDISPAFGAKIADRLPHGALEVMPASATSARSRTPTRPSRRCSGSRGYRAPRATPA